MGVSTKQERYISNAFDKPCNSLDKYKDMLQNLGFTGEQAIRNKMFANSVDSAQKRVEGNNFDLRKTLLEYDDVINEQRGIIYEKRNLILDTESIHPVILDTFKIYVEDVVYSHFDENDNLVCSKIGTTTRKVAQRLKEELRSDTYKKMGAVRCIIHRVYDCGKIPAEGLESLFRANYQIFDGI